MGNVSNDWGAFDNYPNLVRKLLNTPNIGPLDPNLPPNMLYSVTFLFGGGMTQLELLELPKNDP